VIIGVEDTLENKRTYAEIANLGKMGRRAIRQAWFRLGIDLRQAASREILRKPKGGRTYWIRIKGGRRRRHVASAPKESHANLRGRLRRSLSWKVHGADSMEFGYGVSTTAVNAMPRYGKYVEEGTTRMGERPSIGNAVAAVGDRAGRHFVQAFEAERRRGR